MLKKSFFQTLGIGSIVIAVMIVAGCGVSNDTPETMALAQCLTEKKATMYGTNRCPHCNATKELFGYKAFQSVTFVDCDKNKNACGLAGVTGYPTWVFADGMRLEGEQELATIAASAGCEYVGS